MSTAASALAGLLRSRLHQAGVDWNIFVGRATEIIVFGSRAVGLERDSSDLDVLVIGDVPTFKKAGLDVICVSPALARTDTWLSSELAAHVGHYGIWLCGSGEWRQRAISGPCAVAKKTRRIRSLLNGVLVFWTRLHPAFRRKYKTTIRRELQRLGHLSAGEPVPPTAALEAAWLAQQHAQVCAISDLLVAVDPTTARFLKTHILSR